VAVFGVVGWTTGGFDEAAPPAPRVLRPGEVFDQGRFRVQVLHARIVRLKDVFSERRKYHLDVVLRVINKDTSTLRLNSVTGFQAGLSVTSRGRALVDDPKIQRDEATLRTSIGAPDANDAQLHPDFPAVVHTVWALRDGFRPDQVTVGVREWTWAEGVTQPDHWEPGQVAAEVTLKVPG
jgi:hypothetical protein